MSPRKPRKESRRDATDRERDERRAYLLSTFEFLVSDFGYTAIGRIPLASNA